jgi:lysophospholipase L1-like esterase
VIGPFWWTGTPDRDVVRVNRIVKTETAKLGVRYFLDPIDEHWITDRNRAELIGPDGVHPTVAGHAHIADRILADLHSVGVRPSRP